MREVYERPCFSTWSLSCSDVFWSTAICDRRIRMTAPWATTDCNRSVAGTHERRQTGSPNHAIGLPESGHRCPAGYAAKRPSNSNRPTSAKGNSPTPDGGNPPAPPSATRTAARRNRSSASSATATRSARSGYAVSRLSQRRWSSESHAAPAQGIEHQQTGFQLAPSSEHAERMRAFAERAAKRKG